LFPLFAEVRIMVRTALLAFAAALALAAAPAAAQAGDGYGCGYGYGHFYGLWGNPYVYSQGSAYIPPYYAIHPPVYYSPFITMRPYGASPYAWPATYVPPAPAARPVLIMNAHVKNADPQVAKSNTYDLETSAEPVSNPYFVTK
jgi:hypothetical protein